MNLRSLMEMLKEENDFSLQLLRTFVEIESFSHDKEGIDQLSSCMEDTFSNFKLKVTRFPEEKYGDHIKFSMGKGDKQILLISHLDTVYPRGTIKNMPFQIVGDKVLGPGVMDIKASYIMMYHLFKVLKSNKCNDNYKITWLCTSDEEIGSPSGKHIVAEEAKKSSAVLVLEPAAEGGKLKTERKGGGQFTIEVYGKSAHAGVNPEDGANAIEELAYQISQVVTHSNHELGTTINTGEIRGGTLFNVVPDYACTKIDIRIAVPEEVFRIEEVFSNLIPKNKNTRLEVSGTIYRPPMVRTVTTERLFKLSKEVGNSIGISLEETKTGGGSDGNYAAAVGVGVLDGLGVIGGKAHSPNEYLNIGSIAERTALLIGLVERLIEE